MILDQLRAQTRTAHEHASNVVQAAQDTFACFELCLEKRSPAETIL